MPLRRSVSIKRARYPPKLSPVRPVASSNHDCAVLEQAVIGHVHVQRRDRDVPVATAWKSESARPTMSPARRRSSTSSLPHGSFIGSAISEKYAAPQARDPDSLDASAGIPREVDVEQGFLGKILATVHKPADQAFEARPVRVDADRVCRRRTKSRCRESRAHRPSMAAATVPEYSTSSPMFGPWLMPETTKSGGSGIKCAEAEEHAVGRRPVHLERAVGRRWARSGRCKRERVARCRSARGRGPRP